MAINIKYVIRNFHIITAIAKHSVNFYFYHIACIIINNVHCIFVSTFPVVIVVIEPILFFQIPKKYKFLFDVSAIIFIGRDNCVRYDVIGLECPPQTKKIFFITSFYNIAVISWIFTRAGLVSRRSFLSLTSKEKSKK